MFKVSKPEMVNKIYLYDDKMTVLLTHRTAILM